MKFKNTVILIALLTVALFGIAVSGLCEEMTRGFVLKVDKHRVVLEVPNGGERTFHLTSNTSVVWNKQVIPISDLRRNTLVQLTSRNGDALQILLVEVPQ